MTAEELYEKEFGSADNIPKESVIRLLRHFATALKLEREKYNKDLQEFAEWCLNKFEYGYITSHTTDGLWHLHDDVNPVKTVNISELREMWEVETGRREK